MQKNNIKNTGIKILTLKILSVLFFALLSPANSFAASVAQSSPSGPQWFFNPYIGLYFSPNIGSNPIPSHYARVRQPLIGVLGARFHKYIGAEISSYASVDVILNYPLYQRKCYETSLIGIVGTSWQHLSYENYYARWDDEDTAIPRLGVGLHQQLTKHIALRAVYLWEKTSNLGPLSPWGSQNDGMPIKVKDNNTILLGFIVFV